MTTRGLASRADKVLQSVQRWEDEIQSLIDEAEDWMAARSERWQESESCEQWEERVETLQGVLSDLQDLDSTLQGLAEA